MTGKILILSKKNRFGLCLLAAMGLSACDDAGKFEMPAFLKGAGTSGAPLAGEMATAGPTVERDIEAPEIFQVTENGLWDGRPSLGGIWVAHPNVADPERVIIRNEANGKFVIGALFRRERENPGPALQVSSDAAEELGMLAGAPSMLNVTALRREESAANVTPAAIADFDSPAEITATPIDPIAGAAASAIEAAAAVPQPAPATAPAAPRTSSLEKPFIQIGIFSIEANASRTAERLRADGLSAQMLNQQSQGKSFYRVIVGPAPTAADRAAVLTKVKNLGFGDAYFVTN